MQLDTKDLIKLIGFISVIVSMWYDLKTDFKVHVAVTEIRLNALEKQKEPKTIATYQRLALVPNQIEIEDDK